MNQLDPKDIYAFMKQSLKHNISVNTAIFNTMRILKGINPGDTYLENYETHYKKRGTTFVDAYHLMWLIGEHLNPTCILEIGCRTGISICQLLSATRDYTDLAVYLSDTFNDGFVTPYLVKKNLAHLNIPVSPTFIVGNSKKTIPEFKKADGTRFDYILVDGSHDKKDAREDLMNVSDMLIQGGILLFDDIAPDGCDLQDVWESFKEDYSHDFHFCENHSGKGIGVGVKR